MIHALPPSWLHRALVALAATAVGACGDPREGASIQSPAEASGAPGAPASNVGAAPPVSEPTTAPGEAAPVVALDPGANLPGANLTESTAPSSDAGAADSGTPGAPRPTLAGLPPASDVLAMLRLVHAQFSAKWPDPSVDIVTDRARPSNLWTRAVYFEGLMALHGVEPEAERQAAYYDYAVRWGESPSHPWQVVYGAATTIDADAHACGQTYLDLYALDPQPIRIAQLEQSIRLLVDSGNTDAWWWIDALQMAMPVFTRLGVLRSDPSYFESMWNLYAYTRDVEGGGLFDEAAGLWWRDADYTPGGVYTRSPNQQDIYWSRGNGWVIAALARVLDHLPADEAHRAAYEADFRALATAILPLQRGDGLWNTSLSHPTHCASLGEPGEDGPETSGSALFAYGLGWGIRHGLLDAAIYGPPLIAAYEGLRRAVREDGFLGYVQPTGAAPCSGPGPLGAGVVPNFEDFGVGCFLLAGSEVLRLAQ